MSFPKSNLTVKEHRLIKHINNENKTTENIEKIRQENEKRKTSPNIISIASSGGSRNNSIIVNESSGINNNNSFESLNNHENENLKHLDFQMKRKKLKRKKNFLNDIMTVKEEYAKRKGTLFSDDYYNFKIIERDIQNSNFDSEPDGVIIKDVGMIYENVRKKIKKMQEVFKKKKNPSKITTAAIQRYDIKGLSFDLKFTT
jgi:hypothetical protein